MQPMIGHIRWELIAINADRRNKTRLKARSMFSLTPTAAEASPSNSEHLVYVLDDEPEICTLMTRMLTTMGFSVQSFSELTEFELALARKAPQTIILDLTLRKSDAVETIRSLSTKQVGAAILLMSG